MKDITLSAAVRQNLLTLQSTADLMSGVQNKLATGLKVNSALDNPNSFFTASGLNSRAGDLSNLLDDMGQSLQTIKAADKGIQTINDLVETAKAKANQALQTQSQYERKTFAAQYNDLLEQIEDVAKDSSYKGKNLLGGIGNDLTTIFNEDATSKLTIESVDYTDTALSTGLNLSNLAEGQGNTTTLQLQGGKTTINLTDGTSTLKSSSILSNSNAISTTAVLTFGNNSGTAPVALSGASDITAGATVQDLVDGLNAIAGVRAEFDNNTGDLTVYSDEDFNIGNQTFTATIGSFDFDATAFSTTTQLLSESGSFAVGDTLTLTDGNDFELGSFEIDDDTTVADLENFISDFNGVSSDFDTGSGLLTIESETDLTLTSDNTDFAASNFTVDTDGITLEALSDSGFATDGDINRVVDRLNTALSNLRSQASEFGTNLSIVEIRQDYTKTMINTLQEGAGLLTLADTNEEGANLLALQTRQQLASTSLSFASQADQTVLSLF
ncbi:flagellin-like hook-associated protein FlgL [Labrenzia sp. EL_208]|uniref:Flagellin n=1 Tax=Roseibium album TaxID=311410 RepID=A0A0M6ZU98_9HYPH|nr:flagellin [Roseibium album]MBG6143180.1 flagellin-like hook-associated protein FlgL [Labrenzia sp. EL_142]MBG6157083.1 flagellin-like hook-associated protein FlgL [Labrenzia sp. EL_162]MBG6166469.1 flagellin-like hook-associated protein FlgL [Labrenzia sp. EL_195]MBG6172333.1 flagellin-like hook-associated protein FlgL [Labrenzia sp. EL_132]MBG6194976.1 flagellin-like hook-associated protein FlgL [Labrenzia sp. EL_159]MBG6203443.1 flagellin-like hook-associated protein FlgL [Labrenzia sp. 